MSVSAVSGSVFTRNVGSSSARRCSASASLSWAAFVFGSILTSMTGSGKVIDSSTIGMLGVGQRVAGEGVLQADGRGDVARVHRCRLILAVVGVHLQDAPDPLPLALDRDCQDVRARLERPGVDPEERQLAHERVGREILNASAQNGSQSSTGSARPRHRFVGSRPIDRRGRRAATAGSRRPRRASAGRPCS